MRDLKKERERFLLEKFLAASGLRPTAISQGEAPDFLVDLDSGRVGVEVTELLHSATGNELSLRAVESITDRIVSNAWRVYHALSKRPAFVSVCFFEPQIGRTLRRDQVSESLARLVDSLLSSGEQYVHWKNDYADRSLDAIAFVSAHYSQEDRWTVARAGWVATLTPQLLQSAVDRKNTEFSRYMAAAPEIWLLIAVDSSRPSQFFDVDPKLDLSSIQSRFHRTYFLKTSPATLLRCEGSGA